MSEQVSKTIGKICPQDAKRDAVHQAIAPVTLAQPLDPGCPVKLNRSFEAEGCARGSRDCVGIVDPFLTGRAKIGDRVWVFLLPGSIASLRHAWEHHAFPPEDEQDLIPPPPDAPRAEREAFAKKWNARSPGYPPEGYHYICDQCSADGIAPDWTRADREEEEAADEEHWRLIYTPEEKLFEQKK